MLGSFARRLLVTEFAFPESPLLRKRSTRSFFSWYGVDNFVAVCASSSRPSKSSRPALKRVVVAAKQADS